MRHKKINRPTPKQKLSDENYATYVERPWGKYFKLFQEPGVWVKRVEVKAHARLSLQKHTQRSEKWIIVKGTGIAHVNEREIPVKSGTTIDIPLEAVHRMSNTGKENLVFIEVATGEYLGEDDIIRLADDYLRK